MTQENSTKPETGNIKSEEFVENLVRDGKTIYCDETANSFINGSSVPYFYDEEKFKKGQQFFHTHVFGMFIAKFSGLISILAIPTIRNVLIFTKMSGDPLTAYRRYLSTVFHMYVWYKSDFTPGSELWNSVLEVKNKHNSASKRHCKAGHTQISQFDMAITQFGFMGYVLSRPKMVGIHKFTNEELEAFVHLWRVIGTLMGIEDRFNICRESAEETRNVCNKILETVLKPEIEKMDKDFVDMSTHLVDGMWCMQPLLQINVFLSYILSMLNSEQKNSDNNNCRVELTKGQVWHLWFIANVISTMRFRILKLYHNTVMYISMWLMVHFPFLAYYKFGKANSHVTISTNKPITKNETTVLSDM